MKMVLVATLMFLAFILAISAALLMWMWWPTWCEQREMVVHREHKPAVVHGECNCERCRPPCDEPRTVVITEERRHPPEPPPAPPHHKPPVPQHLPMKPEIANCQQEWERRGYPHCEFTIFVGEGNKLLVETGFAQAKELAVERGEAICIGPRLPPGRSEESDGLWKYSFVVRYRDGKMVVRTIRFSPGQKVRVDWSRP